MDDQTDRQPEEAIDLAHPLRVTLGQIVVDRDDMHALPAECVKIGGQNGHEGLAFACLHLGDTSLMQDDTADELHMVRPHSQHAVGRLAADRESLRQKIIQRFARLIAFLEFVGLGAELLIRELRHLRAERLDALHLRQQLFDLALRAGTEQFCKYTHISIDLSSWISLE